MEEGSRKRKDTSPTPPTPAKHRVTASKSADESLGREDAFEVSLYRINLLRAHEKINSVPSALKEVFAAS